MSPLIAALALFVSDAGVGDPIDAGPPTLSDGGNQTFADLDWSPSGDTTGLVWVDERRDLSFLASPSRRADLWVNGWRPDGGLVFPYGQVLCRAASKEIFSQPRLASTTDGTFVVAWRVETLGHAGHSIRVGTFTSAGLGSCNEVLVPNNGTPLNSVRLRQSGGQFLVTWVTPSEVRGQYVRMPSTQDSFLIATAAVPAVTLAASATGFLAAWDQGDLFWSASVPLFGSGVPSTGPASTFAAQSPISQSTAAGLELRGAFLGGTLGRNVYFGPLSAMPGTDMPLQGPSAGEHPLLTASLGARHFVASETATENRFAVTEFSTAGFYTTPSLTAGLEPQAMVTNQRNVLLLLGASDATLLLLQLKPQTMAPPTFVTPVSTTRALPNQLAPSLVPTAPASWLLGWNEGPNFATAQLSPDGRKTLVPQPRLGFTSLVQIADGPSLALNVSGNAVTNLYRSSVDGGRETTALLTAAGEQRLTLVGNQAAAVWNAGTDGITFGTGSPRPISFGGFRLGRCGVWADNSMFIPAVGNGGELRIIELRDEGGASAIVHSMGTAQRAVLPCLAVRGTDLLVVSDDSVGGLFLAMTSVTDVRADRPARAVSFPNTSNRVVSRPVAAATSRGWQLAWEAPDEFGSAIAGLKLAVDGTVLAPPAALATGLDERSPVLVSSPGGAVALVWEHFADTTGNVQVRWQIIPSDALLPDGGPGAELDGGVDLQPIVFTSCGCESGALPTLAGLALLLFSRRRARPRS